MRDEAAARAMQDGWTVLIEQAKIIAMLPLEDWLAAFDRAETLAPILDPTLYRGYIYDPDKKGELIKDLIRAAVPLKREILKLQERFREAGKMCTHAGVVSGDECPWCTAEAAGPAGHI